MPQRRITPIRVLLHAWAQWLQHEPRGLDMPHSSPVVRIGLPRSGTFHSITPNSWSKPELAALHHLIEDLPVQLRNAHTTYYAIRVSGRQAA